MKKDLSNYKLEEYQEEAVNELLTKTSQSINEDIKKGTNVMVFQAITGAGKTIMMGDYIKQVSKEYDDVAFVWVSTGNGGLVEQSFVKVKEMLSNHIKFYNHENISTTNSLTPKSILFLNWQKFNMNKNILMKRGEKNNLPDIFDRTRKNGVKVILIIDEGHHSAHSDISLDLRENLFNPIITIEVSATPSNIEKLKINKIEFIKVDIEKVIEAGIIKKRIIINKDYSKHKNNYDIYEEMLAHALQRQVSLYQALERKINPLILVQIPDGEEGTKLKSHIIEFLNKKGIKEEQIAVWLSEDKMNLEKDSISDWNNPVKFLIFKTAIATGWDCPRAQILVKFREVKSDTFNTQVLGRIIRMPERKHYDNEILNNAYIYTNEKEIILDSKNNILETFMDIAVQIKEEFQDDVKDIILPKQHLKKSRNKSLTQREIEEQFKLEIDKIEENMPNGNTYFKLDKTTFFEITKETEVSSIVLQEKESQVNVEHGTFENNAKDYELAFERLIRKYVPKQNWDDMKTTIFLELRERYGSNVSSTEIHKMIKSYEKDFIQIFNKIFKNKNNPSYEITNLEIKIPTEKLYKYKKEGLILKEYKNCLYEGHYITEKEPKTEKIFEEVLGNCENIKWWFKNSDRGKDYPSVVYKNVNEDNYYSFYPDYTIMFNDGSIGFYEVKDTKTSESSKTKLKMKALEEYLVGTEFKCGLIVVDQDIESVTIESKKNNMDIFR